MKSWTCPRCLFTSHDGNKDHVCNNMFNEKNLRADIVKIFGEYGEHIDVFDMIMKKFEEYGNHKTDCLALFTPNDPCTCGWTKLKREVFGD